jgi:hypothetical protein
MLPDCVKDYVGSERYALNGDGGQPLLQKQNRFVLCPQFLTEINKVAGQFSVVLGHEKKPNL